MGCSAVDEAPQYQGDSFPMPAVSCPNLLYFRHSLGRYSPSDGSCVLKSVGGHDGREPVVVMKGRDAVHTCAPHGPHDSPGGRLMAAPDYLSCVSHVITFYAARWRYYHKHGFLRMQNPVA